MNNETPAVAAFPQPVCTLPVPHPRHRIEGTWRQDCRGDGPAVDLDALRAAAELHMLDVLRVPSTLLPSGMTGHPLLPLSVALRQATLRRLRLGERLRVAAETVAGQAHAVIALTEVRRSPAGSQPVDPADAATVTQLSAQILELDRRLADEAVVLNDCARAYVRAHGLTAAQPWDGALPDATESALQRGLGG